MPYVARDASGRIVGISDRAGPATTENLPNDHPDVIRYLNGLSPDSMRQRLNQSDLEMARIAEDLIDVLVARNILNFTDLPREAQRKLIARQRLRRNLSALSTLVNQDDDIL
jgi:hypothetical protein